MTEITGQVSASATRWSTKATAVRQSAAGKALVKERTARREQNRSAWADRHPQLADEERAMRKARVERTDRWKHKNFGTAETHEQASHVRQGALTRLHLSGAIDNEQLAAGAEIAAIVEMIGRDVTVRTASLETRVDRSPHGDAFWESLRLVRMEVAYSRWRTKLGPRANLVLDIVVQDDGVTIAARRHGMSVRRARALLIAALDLWGAEYAAARGEVAPATLAAAQAGIL